MRVPTLSQLGGSRRQTVLEFLVKGIVICPTWGSRCQVYQRRTQSAAAIPVRAYRQTRWWFRTDFWMFPSCWVGASWWNMISWGVYTQRIKVSMTSPVNLLPSQDSSGMRCLQGTEILIVMAKNCMARRGRSVGSHYAPCPNISILSLY